MKEVIKVGKYKHPWGPDIMNLCATKRMTNLQKNTYNKG